MIETYLCRTPDHGHDSDDDWQKVEHCCDAEQAAEEYAERIYHEEPSDADLTVEVKHPDGQIETFYVETQTEPVFVAHRVKGKETDGPR